jgi:predicted CXXCH cytochrome family protein
VGFLGLGGAIFLFSSCGTLQRTVVAPPEIPGAHFVGNKTCAECHTNIARIFPASPHARFGGDNLKMAGLTGCESCHGAGSKHVSVGGGKGQFIINPGKESAACFQCHIEVHAEFKLPHHHPVIEKRLNCVQCHDPHGSDIRKPAGGLAMARLNDTCASCHREQTKPVIYEHEALRDGCLACHNPHGSINSKMLTQRDVNLCLRCHAQNRGTVGLSTEVYIGKVPHAAFIRQGACWSAGCHTAVHGSNISPRLFY